MTELRRTLSLRDLVFIVVGTVIGSGIFLTPGAVVRASGSGSVALLVWAVGGILSLLGALNTPYQFKSGVTVFNDASIDRLTGGAGLDWFFAKTGVDIITDKNNGGPETVDALERYFVRTRAA